MSRCTSVKGVVSSDFCVTAAVRGRPSACGLHQRSKGAEHREDTIGLPMRLQDPSFARRAVLFK